MVGFVPSAKMPRSLQHPAKEAATADISDESPKYVQANKEEDWQSNAASRVETATTIPCIAAASTRGIEETAEIAQMASDIR